MANSEPRASHLRNIGEQIAALPYQLGYRPADSVVMVTLHDRGDGPGRLATHMTLRVDIPPDRADYPHAVAQLVHFAVRDAPTMVQLFAFEDDTDGLELLVMASCAMRAAGFGVPSQVRVRGGRWQRLDDEGPGDPPWHVVPDADRVPVVADYVLLGASPAGGRVDLARRLADGRLLSQGAVREAWLDRPLVLDRQASWDAGARAWAKVLDRPARARLSVDELVDLVDAMGDKQFRDAVLAWLCPGQLSPAIFAPRLLRTLARYLPVARTRAPWLEDELVEVCRQLPEELSVPLLTALAQVAWWHGSGSLANIAVERALDIDPDYSLAQLLDHVLQHGLKPGAAAFVGRESPGRAAAPADGGP